MATDPVIITAFEQLYADYVQPGTGREIPYNLTAPKWQFLCYVCEQKGLLLHGSSNPGIEEFEPRQANDSVEFGNRKAVYASSDGIWPFYFAITDRQQVKSMVNGVFKVLDEQGRAGQPYYYFSVDETALPNHPWHPGTIYLLPSDTFEQQPLEDFLGQRIEITQWASPVAVKPLAKLTVMPEDFPFLADVNGHDRQRVNERANRDPYAFPWRD